jgi:hypothetical protein
LVYALQPPEQGIEKSTGATELAAARCQQRDNGTTNIAQMLAQMRVAAGRASATKNAFHGLLSEHLIVLCSCSSDPIGGGYVLWLQALSWANICQVAS